MSTLSGFSSSGRAGTLRIALLAGCLEPGRDGVGDYTHGLAVEAMAAGASIFTVALADRFVSPESLSERDGVPVLRLSHATPWPERVARVQMALRAFEPNWISLQFVPYSFHPRGWVHGLAQGPLPSLQGSPAYGRSFHLMFHELWLNATGGAPWKHRLEGLWQRMGILAFTRAMRPALIHTSNPTYASVLSRSKVLAKVLPLFGSIPVTGTDAGQDAAADAWFANEVRALGVLEGERKLWWLFGVFGAIHPEWWPGELFSALLASRADDGHRLALLTLGRARAAGEEVLRRLEREFAGRVTVRRLGEQPPERIAAAFRQLDFGISTSPWSLSGKSSSTVAMREHGLPVIVTRSDSTRESVEPDPAMGDRLLLRFDATLPGKLAGLQRDAPQNRRAAVTRQWVSEMSAATAGSSVDPRAPKGSGRQENV